LLDPLRVLRDVQVELSAEAIREIKRAYPEFFAAVGREGGSYELVARSTALGNVRITLEAMIRREAS
jgi:hypothetical protein